MFAALASCLAAAYLYLALRQHLHPSDLRHHALFASATPAWVVSALELASGACMAITGLSMLMPREQPGRAAAVWRRLRCPAALLLALAWCTALWLVQQVRSCWPAALALRQALCDSMMLLDAGWDPGAGLAICMASPGAAGLHAACCSRRHLASGQPCCRTPAARPDVHLQGAVNYIDGLRSWPKGKKIKGTEHGCSNHASSSHVLS